MTLLPLATRGLRFENSSMPSPRRRIAFALAAALPLALGSCKAPHPIQFASDPPGASVLVDGVDTGFVTPCMLDIPDEDSRRVDIRLTGYQPATRYLTLQRGGELVYWRDSITRLETWRFPLWLGSEDFFIPYKRRGGESPARVYVRLRREADL